MNPSPVFSARKAASAFLCAAALFAAGCHNNNSNSSGYGRIWATVTDDPGDYTGYITTISQVTLTDTLGNVYSAVAVPEIVDFTQLNNFSEMWGVGAVPVGTYTEATITLSYSTALVYVMVNGQPQKANILDYATGGVPNTYSVNIKFDPATPLNITSTYASTSALRLAIDFNLAASGTVDLSTNPATVYVRPYITAGLLAPDTRPIRIRGPVVNSALRPALQAPTPPTSGLSTTRRTTSAPLRCSPRTTRSGRSTASTTWGPPASPRSPSCPPALP